MAKRAIMPSEDRKKFKKILLELRARLNGDVSMLAREALSGEGESSHAPTHMADLGTDAYEKEFTLNLMASDGDRLQQIQAALERIASGEYGACLECDGRIPKGRLEILPDTPYCVKCASKVTKRADEDDE